MRKRLVWLAAAALPWVAAGAWASGCEQGSEESPPSIVVSTSWLAERLDDSSVVVLHVARGRVGYEAGHVPGARFVPLSALVVEVDGLPNELPPVERLDSVFQSVGVSDGSIVVAYGEDGGLAAARALFTLDYLGAGVRGAVLDGGWAIWKAEGRPVSREEVEVAPASLTVRPRPGLVVTAEWLIERLEDPGVVILDARPAAEYAGSETGAGVSRPGHIPGAHNLFWETTLVSQERPIVRDIRALRRAFEAAGVKPGDVVVTYCRTGVQASHLYVVARLLGYETRLYDGSYIDWSRRDLPVAE